MVLHFVNDPLPAFCMKLDRIVLLSGISQLRRAGFYLAPKFYESAHSIQQSSSCNFRPNRFSPPYPTSATIWRHCCRSCVRWSIHNWHSILPFSLSSSPLHNYIVIPGSNLQYAYDRILFHCRVVTVVKSRIVECHDTSFGIDHRNDLVVHQCSYL